MILLMVQGLGIEWRFMILTVRDAVFLKLSVYIPPPVRIPLPPISGYSAQRVYIAIMAVTGAVWIGHYLSPASRRCSRTGM